MNDETTPNKPSRPVVVDRAPRPDVSRGPGTEHMVDARRACVALCLPHYWFADPEMRELYRIPHYLVGSSVRYRMSELYAWAEEHVKRRSHASAGVRSKESHGHSRIPR